MALEIECIAAVGSQECFGLLRESMSIHIHVTPTQPDVSQWNHYIYVLFFFLSEPSLEGGPKHSEVGCVSISQPSCSR